MKPTPLQARMLRLLNVGGAFAIVGGMGRAWIDRDRESWPAYGDPAYDAANAIWKEALSEADLKRLRRASVEACGRAGWIVQKQNGPHDWNRGWFLTEAGRDIVAMLGPEDFEDRPKGPTSPLLSIDVIRDGLRDRWHEGLGWIWFWEFYPRGNANGRRLDGMVVNRWGGKYGFERMGFEIKRSRSDFRAELREPAKRTDGASVVDRFWFVTPAGLIEAREIPGECGLVWVDEDGRVTVRRKAPKRPPAPTSRSLIGAILAYMVDRPSQRKWRKAIKELGG